MSTSSSDPPTPRINSGWIYSMITFGFVGSVTISILILVSAYKAYKLSKRKHASYLIVTLNLIIWTCNLVACLQWALFRTNIVRSLSTSKCVITYISNYLFFMIAKYFLHLLLLYRLYFTFMDTMYSVNGTFIGVLMIVITINFILFSTLWARICIDNITVAVSTHSDSLQICTLYNSASNPNLTVYDQLWPILFGGQDFVVGVITLILFVKKIRDLSVSPPHRSLVDASAQALIRKLVILGVVAIVSTFVFYTFAIPFWPNLTFLLPLDALINSLCIVLLLEYASPLYRAMCCCLDIPLKRTLHHIDAEDTSLFDGTQQRNNQDIKLEPIQERSQEDNERKVEDQQEEEEKTEGMKVTHMGSKSTGELEYLCDSDSSSHDERQILSV